MLHLPSFRRISKATSIGNLQAVQIAIDNNAEIRYDETAQSPWFSYTRDGERIPDILLVNNAGQNFLEHAVAGCCIFRLFVGYENMLNFWKKAAALLLPGLRGAAGRFHVLYRVSERPDTVGNVFLPCGKYRDAVYALLEQGIGSVKLTIQGFKLPAGIGKRALLQLYGFRLVNGGLKLQFVFFQPVSESRKNAAFYQVKRCGYAIAVPVRAFDNRVFCFGIPTGLLPLPSSPGS